MARRCWLVVFALAGCSADSLTAHLDQSPAPPADAAVADAAVPTPPSDDGAAPDAAPPVDLALTLPPVDALRPAGDLRGGPCPAEMVALPGVCMDRYEAPNQAGVKPLAFQTAPDGIAWCSARGKRLCTEAEWVRACQGPSGLPYPYGNTYVHGRCDDDKTWIAPNWTVLGEYPNAASLAEAARLYQADPSGQRSGCVSAEGVMDLDGNVAEWVTRSFNHATNYDQVMKGCYWAGCYGGTPPNCAFTNPAHPGTFRTYEAGFRCCQDR